MKNKKPLSYKSQLLFMLFGLAVSGCAHQQKSISRSPDQWQLQGKIAVTSPNPRCQVENCQPNSSQGNITWRQLDSQYTLSIRDPFNRVIMEITGDDNQLQASAPNQPIVTAPPKTFISQLLQTHQTSINAAELQPNDLRYWITGRPSPRLPVENRQDEQFTQNNYEIRARQWRSTDVGLMPSIVDIQKNAFKLRIIIQNWEKG